MTYKLDLDILPLDLLATIQVHMSVSLAMRVVTHTQTQRHTHRQTMSKLLHPTRHRRGCNNFLTLFSSDMSELLSNLERIHSELNQIIRSLQQILLHGGLSVYVTTFFGPLITCTLIAMVHPSRKYWCENCN